jgi:hypothetical protein
MPTRSRLPAELTVIIIAILLLELVATAASTDRGGAFVGYSEHSTTSGYGMCNDRTEACQADAGMNKCLTDPYNMRRSCPVSCLLEPCIETGTALVGGMLRTQACCCCWQRPGRPAAALLQHCTMQCLPKCTEWLYIFWLRDWDGNITLCHRPHWQCCHQPFLCRALHTSGQQ